MWSTQGHVDKARALLHIAFPSRRFLATKYPVAPTSPRIWLCYLSHWRDLVERYGAPWSGLPREPGTPEQDRQRDRMTALSKWLLNQ